MKRPVARRSRAQLFSTDFLASVLVITVALGLFVHALDFSGRAFPDSASLAPSLSSALLASRIVVPMDPGRMVQGGFACNGRGTAQAWCYPLQPLDGPIKSRYVDSDAFATGALSVVYENGRPLGPAHSSFGVIQTVGNGSFSDWLDAASGQSYVVFSSSDGSSPAQNGRLYELEFVTAPLGLDRLSRDFCVSESLSGRVIQDNCASIMACPFHSGVDRFTACGSSLCTYSVRVCGGGG